MKTATISRGGQVQVPAEVRHRWGTRDVLIEDRGDALIVRPLPVDPIGAARGSLRGTGPSSDRMRASVRAEDAAIEKRRALR